MMVILYHTLKVVKRDGHGEYSFNKDLGIEEMIISKLNLSDNDTKEKIFQIISIL